MEFLATYRQVKPMGRALDDVVSSTYRDLSPDGQRDPERIVHGVLARMRDTSGSVQGMILRDLWRVQVRRWLKAHLSEPEMVEPSASGIPF